MKKILTILIGLSLSTINTQDLKMGGIQEFATRFLEEGHKNYVSQSDKIKAQITTLEKKQLELTNKKSLLSPERYELEMKQLQRRIDNFEESLGSLTKAATKTADLFTNVIGEGAKIALKNIENKQKHDHEIVLTAVTQEVKNEGNLRIAALLTSPDTMARLGITLAATATGIFVSYHSAHILADQIDTYLNKPKLIQESSKQGLLGLIDRLMHKPTTESPLENIVLPQSIKDQVEHIAQATTAIAQYNARVAKQDRIPHSGLMLFGPPGTGKTLIGRAIAKRCGLPFYYLSGTAFDALDLQDAVKELNKLLDYAHEQGAIIFFDEGDSIGRKREFLSDRNRNILLTLLAKTGNEESHAKIIFTTNNPEDLDEALIRRLHEKIIVDMPGLTERLDLLQQKIKKYFMQGAKKDFVIASTITTASLQPLAQRLDNFSGSDIDSLVRLTLEQLIVSNQKTLTLEQLNNAADIRIQQKANLALFKK